MSGTGKINDFVPIGTSLVGEVTFHGKVTGKNNKDEQIERLQEQLNEANEVVKLYAETFAGNKNKDGTFTIYVFGSFPTNKNVYGYQELRYDPRPAEKYLEKWGVK